MYVWVYVCMYVSVMNLLEWPLNTQDEVPREKIQTMPGKRNKKIGLASGWLTDFFTSS